MKFIADFHVHSKFSIATAKNLDLENLYIAAQLKGIKVVGTGDFTHPGWFSEIKEKLVPAEEGLFKLKEAISSKCDAHVPPSCRDQVRFILVSEISNIYKKKNKTRKNHNLVFVPDLSIVERFNKKLEKIGNIKSDGRPILGLDARNLFEILLETSEQNYLIPAHIWTPWFSILGSKSGFDSIDECFEDLTHQIFAIETGLSSDPPMNRRVSALDGLTLVSNSDAHSPLKVGREANIFDTELSYSAIKSAIKSGDPKRFLGTFEFFPEEGKYHLDGHRKCNVRLNPKESMKQGGKCPVCGKPLTLGVLYRVEELSDRAEGATPQKKHPFYSIVPLTEILAEIFRVGSGSKKVQQGYHGLLDKLGPEFEILHSLKTQTIDKSGVPLLGEAIRRMRAKEIFINPGYDGEFGKIKIFKEDEREKLLGQKSLFVLPASDSFKKNKKITCDARLKKGKKHQKFIKKHSLTTTASKSREKGILFGELNEEQRKAVLYNDGPLLIVAGPGTGKTRTLTHKVAYLVCQEKVSSEQVLAMTFTNKAAQEMRDRLRSMMPDSEPLPRASTFHSFCLEILKTHEGVNMSKFSGIIDENDRKTLILEAVKKVEKNGVKITKPPLFFLDRVIAAKQMLRGLTDNFKTIVDNSETEMFSAVYASYQLLLEIQGLYDYEDLIFKVVGLFKKNKAVRRKYQEQYRYVLVDEYQDLNYGQYRIVQTLVPPEKPHQNLCVIGDPDQSIYGFRGSDVKYFKRFLREYPKTKVIRLTRNYRSTETILEASHQVINNYSTSSSESRIYSGINGVRTIGVLEANTAKGEAVAVGKMIEKLVGGIGFHSIDFNKVDDENHEGSRGFSDFAVLYRTGEQGKVFAKAFDRAGIPYQITSKETIFNHKGVRYILSFLRLVEGYGSCLDLERAINFSNSGVGKTTLEHLKNWVYKNRFSVHEAIVRARQFPIQGLRRDGQLKLNKFFSRISVLVQDMQNMAVDQKLNHIAEQYDRSTKPNPIPEEIFNRMISISKNFGGDTFGFLSTLSLQTDTDIYDSCAERVSLMTLHASKGLEFPVVFITGCEDKLIPFQKVDDRPANIHEERRLFYVAMTRAQENLYLTYAKKRMIYGRQVVRTMSPFVEQIEKHLRQKEATFFSKKKKEPQQQLKLF